MVEGGLTMKQNDMDVLAFARAIVMLPTNTPKSIAFDNEYGQKKGRWCLNYPTGGVPGFEHKPNSSARKMYAHFGRPETLLWLAEALGEDETVLDTAIKKINSVDNLKTKMKVLKQEIPFDRILELMAA